ncbi:hypothetical protein VB735_24755 [Halotia wernerae UHCC 0503]|nr:hypothetical protein [Halotia wernerae UHCC 0503]
MAANCHPALLDNEVLQTTSATLLWEIYHRLSQWLLGYPLIDGIKTMLLRSGSAHIHRTPEAIANLLFGRYPQDLLVQMQAIALQILHSYRHQVTLSAESNTNTLPVFYFHSFASPQVQRTITTEFSHPKESTFVLKLLLINCKP